MMDAMDFFGQYFSYGKSHRMGGGCGKVVYDSCLRYVTAVASFGFCPGGWDLQS